MNYDHINPRPRRRPDGEPPAADAPPETACSPDEPDAPMEAEPAPGPGEKPGYRNPPKKHQWKKGTSGNPKGKARGTKSLGSWIDHEMDVELEVTDRGKKRQYPKVRVAAMRIVNKAVEGDDKALTVLLRREGNMAAASNASATPLVSDEPLAPAEQSILDHFMEAARLAAEREREEKSP